MVRGVNSALFDVFKSDRRVGLMLVMPSIDDFAHTPRKARRTAAAQQSAWEQACRQRWRALLLIIRAKLEAVESGITTLESEFLANIVLPDGGTPPMLRAG